MKLSVYNHPGYRNVRGQGWRVMLDGKPLERVFRVDTDAGIAWVHATDTQGNPMYNGWKEPVEIEVCGSIHVEAIPNARDAGRPGD